MISAYPSPSGQTIELVVAFARAQRIRRVHYWGYADEGLITALQALPHLQFGVTDVFDRWKRGLWFWHADEINLDPGADARPSWLTGVKMFQEGLLRNTQLLISDLSDQPNPFEGLAPGEGITHLVVFGQQRRRRRCPWPEYDWSSLGTVEFGIRRRSPQQRF